MNFNLPTILEFHVCIKLYIGIIRKNKLKLKWICRFLRSIYFCFSCFRSRYQEWFEMVLVAMISYIVDHYCWVFFNFQIFKCFEMNTLVIIWFLLLWLVVLLTIIVVFFPKIWLFWNVIGNNLKIIFFWRTWF